MSLALAPADRYEDGLELMQLEAEKVVAELLPLVQKFLAYLQKTWAPIADKVSVYGCRVRTTNLVESFHSTLLKKFGGAHPNLWIFLGK